MNLAEWDEDKPVTRTYSAGLCAWCGEVTPWTAREVKVRVASDFRPDWLVRPTTVYECVLCGNDLPRGVEPSSEIEYTDGRRGRTRSL